MNDKSGYAGLVMLLFTLHARKQLQMRKDHDHTVVLRTSSFQRTIHVVDELCKKLGIEIDISTRTKQRVINELVESKLLTLEVDEGHNKVGLSNKIFQELMEELRIGATF